MPLEMVLTSGGAKVHLADGAWGDYPTLPTLCGRVVSKLYVQRTAKARRRCGSCARLAAQLGSRVWQGGLQ